MKYSGCLNRTATNLDRRDFLRVGSLSFLGIGLRQWMQLSELMAANNATGNAKAEACILLWLEGGPSHIDTWDPKTNSTFKPISTNVPGIQISELLPRIARKMDKLSVIRSVHTEEVDHATGSYYALTGHRPNAAMTFPSLGSIIAKEKGARNDVPAHVLEPKWDMEGNVYHGFFGSAFLGTEYDPMVLPDPSKKDFVVPDLSLPKTLTVDRVRERLTFQKEVDRLYRQKMELAEYGNLDTVTERALQTILSPTVKKAFDLSKESDKTKEAYGTHGFGQSVLLARRMVEAGSRFVTAAGFEFNEWDTHGNSDKRHRDQLTPKLDQTLSTLLEDLEQRGLLKSTIVLVMGEFGRTPNLNPSGGRDHYPACWSLAVGGGGVRGGQIVGASDERGAQVASRMVTMGDLFATLYKAFGIDWTKEYMTPIGRPIKIANAVGDVTGTPISELV